MVFGFGSSTPTPSGSSNGVHLDLVPLTPQVSTSVELLRRGRPLIARQKDIPDPTTPAFAQFLNDHFSDGEKLASSLEQVLSSYDCEITDCELTEVYSEWKHNSVKCEGSVQIVDSSRNHPVSPFPLRPSRLGRCEMRDVGADAGPGSR